MAVHNPPGTTARVSLSATSEHVELLVEADGPGLQGVDLEDIFKVFHQGSTDAHSPRMGLGLAKVDLFAELHGGAWAETSDLGGLAVHIVLSRRVIQTDG